MIVLKLPTSCTRPGQLISPLETGYFGGAIYSLGLAGIQLHTGLDDI